MESSAQNVKNKRTKTGGGSGDDLISGLSDDVLLRILGLVANAEGVARTSALSRRWRNLWTRAPVLRFTASLRNDDGKAQRFFSFLENALTLRLSQSSSPSEDLVERLEIRVEVDPDLHHRVKQDVALFAVESERWLRYALRHGVRSFDFVLSLYPWPEGEPTCLVIDLEELPPIRAKLETMFLSLDATRVRLPATAAFPSLTDLTLECITVERTTTSSSNPLSALLSSSCCPRLQKLRMMSIELEQSPQLLIEANALTELSMESIHHMRSLELRTPGLRVLSMTECNYESDLNTLRITAPKLEDLSYMCTSHSIVDIQAHLPSVRRLELDLSCSKETIIFLLQCCSSVRTLDLCFYHPEIIEQGMGKMKDRLSRLPHVTSLNIGLSIVCEWHSFGGVIASFLKIFTNLRYLCLEFTKDYDTFTCNLDGWTSHHEISLVKLHQAELKVLTGSGCELGFLRSLLSGATELQKLTIKFSSRFSKGMQESSRHDFVHKLLDKGTWVHGHDSITHTSGGRVHKWRTPLYLLGELHVLPITEAEAKIV